MTTPAPAPAPVPSTPAQPAPTQVKHPARAVLRTLFAVIVGLAGSWGVVVETLHLNPTWGWVSVGSLVAAGITRALADPRVEAFLQKYVPWLSAQPKA